MRQMQTISILHYEEGDSMRVYNRDCEKLNKEIANVDELENDEYLLKSLV